MKRSHHHKKKIKPKRKGSYDIIIISRDTKDEARRIVKLLKNFKRDNIIPDYGYVALLFKSVKYHAGKILTELEREGIQYTIKGGMAHSSKKMK